jgi:ATP-dependent Clp protease, protease subunit
MSRQSNPVFAMARPAALPQPQRGKISAFTRPEVHERFAEDAAGIRSLAKGDNVITMFDIIGEDWWTGGGITSKSVAAQLRAIGDRPVEVHINSPGGDMFEGIGIYNVLREHSQDVTVKVMGMAASAASIIAMAGDRIEIGAASFLMIHDCWTIALGNKSVMRSTADFLEPFDQAVADLYAARSGQKAADCSAWMTVNNGDGTWLSGSQAVEKGFADALMSNDQITHDEGAKAADREANQVRAMELALLAQGKSRTEAHARIKELRGTTDSAPPADTTDSVGNGLASSLAELASKFSQKS